MILGPLRWELLGLFVTEDICKGLVLVRNSFVCLYSSDDCFSSLGSGSKYCFVGIVTLHNDRELGIVDPSLGPVNLWLHTSKPGVSKDYVIFAQVCEEVAQVSLLFSCLHGHVHIIL